MYVVTRLLLKLIVVEFWNQLFAPCATPDIPSPSFTTDHNFPIVRWLNFKSHRVRNGLHFFFAISIFFFTNENFIGVTDDMPAGQTPHTVFVFAHNDLVDKVQPGDRVTVTGIYRAVSLRVNPIQSNVKSVYRTHIDVVHYRKIDVHRLRNQTERGYYCIYI
jgi:hypothetical protein